MEVCDSHGTTEWSLCALNYLPSNETVINIYCFMNYRDTV